VRRALLLLVCGCNPLYGIEKTALWDAAPDAPDIDARPPPVCPGIGTLPVFGTELNQVAARNVYSFTLDEGASMAVGMATDNTRSFEVPVVGTAGAPLEPATMSPEVMWPASVRLSTEGDTLFVTSWLGDLGTYATTPYALDNGTWTQSGMSFAPPNNMTAWGGHTLSAPSRGPRRRFLTQIIDSNLGVNVLVELEHDGVTATELWRTPVTELGIDGIAQQNLSPDGLRTVFIGTTVTDPSGEDAGMEPISGERVMYLDRPDVKAPFQGPARVLDTVPESVYWPYLSDDCERIYFFALNTTWYLKLAQ
jgi:hypothetical protein